MLEWMKDPTISCFFRFDAASMDEDKCRNFIRTCTEDQTSRHYAIVDESDEYMGTISLKDINNTHREAEYAISTRKKIHGSGLALTATKQILEIAFNELNLQKVFLNVLVINERANHFYQKAGFSFDYLEKEAVSINGQMCDLNWYSIEKDNWHE